MHLYIITRGIIHDAERFVKELSSKYMLFPRHTTDISGAKIIKPCALQVSVRPIQLFEIVFPKEQLSCMVNTLGGAKALEGQESVGYLKKYAKWFRKLMHLNPIENIDATVMPLPVYRDNVEIIALGTKPDKEFEDGTEYI